VGVAVDHGIYVATSGFLAQQWRLDVIANNLANATTVGYKEDVPLFRTSEFSSAAVQSDSMGPVWDPIYVGLSENATDFSQGALTKTGNPLDVALTGEGFFVIETPQGERYTRKGDFALDRDGSLITQDGYPVIGEGGRIFLSEGEIQIDREGGISVEGNKEGRLRVVLIEERNRLVKEGKALFRWQGRPGDVTDLERPDVRQGYVEMSNVNSVREMVHMIDAIRTYEAQQKMIHAFDDAKKKAVGEVGRLR